MGRSTALAPAHRLRHSMSFQIRLDMMATSGKMAWTEHKSEWKVTSHAMDSSLSLLGMSVNLRDVQTFFPRSQGRLWDAADHGDIDACSVSPL